MTQYSHSAPTYIMANCKVFSVFFFRNFLVNDQYKGMNTEIAEQSFNKLNMFKYSTRKMTYSRRLVFLKFLDDTVNTMIDAKNC